jgi:periplasmic protein TonB
MRTLISSGLGLLVTLALFVLMNTLISGSSNAGDAGGGSELQDFVRVQREETTREKERLTPKRPEIQKRPPTPTQAVQQQQVQDNQVDIDLPKMDLAPGQGGGGPFIPTATGTGRGAGFGDGDLIPIVRIEPQFPREALINGISGYVRVSFMVMEDGSVEPGTVKVIEAKPPRLFDSAAQRAVARWKFKPRIVDGRPVKRPAEQTINFNLEAEDDKK